MFKARTPTLLVMLTLRNAQENTKSGRLTGFTTSKMAA